MIKKITMLCIAVIHILAINSFANGSEEIKFDIDYETSIATISGTTNQNSEILSIYVEAPTGKLEYIGNVPIINWKFSISFKINNAIENGQYNAKIKLQNSDNIYTKSAIYAPKYFQYIGTSLNISNIKISFRINNYAYNDVIITLKNQLLENISEDVVLTNDIGEFNKKIAIPLNYEYDKYYVELLADNGKLKEIKEINCNETDINCIKDKQFDLFITGNNIKTFDGVFYCVQYDPKKLQIIDLCSLTSKLDVPTQSNDLINTQLPNSKVIIVELDKQNGKIKFKINTLLNEKQWTGIINAIKFKSLVNSYTTITIKQTAE
ncbi:MAG: hypothetical protein BGN88_08890 [Clostridiales bacterium 43-6]|nr:MAG: hypothetical protein BGN88_08890 [Clostridiales bacterium 43-6]